MPEPKRCTCGKLMIQRDTGEYHTSLPPQYGWEWWCGGCGQREDGGVRRGKTESELLAEWRRLNEEVPNAPIP